MWRSILLSMLVATSLASTDRSQVEQLLNAYGREGIAKMTIDAFETLTNSPVSTPVHAALKPWDYVSNAVNFTQGFVIGMQEDETVPSGCLSQILSVETDSTLFVEEITRCIFFNLTACTEVANIGNVAIELL
jgi:hypothetical protein